MKVSIRYEYDPSYGSMYWAHTTVNKNLVSGCGVSFAAARQRLLEKLGNITKPPVIVPPDEVVEV